MIFGTLAVTVGLSTSTLVLFRFIDDSGCLGYSRFQRTSDGTLDAFSLDRACYRGDVCCHDGIVLRGAQVSCSGIGGIVFYTSLAHVFVISADTLDERATTLRLLTLTVAIADVGLIVGRI